MDRTSDFVPRMSRKQCLDDDQMQETGMGGRIMIIIKLWSECDNVTRSRFFCLRDAAIFTPETQFHKADGDES